jgi:hypothetical protein
VRVTGQRSLGSGDFGRSLLGCLSARYLARLLTVVRLFFGALVAFASSPAALAAEIPALRHQLAVLQRSSPARRPFPRAAAGITTPTAVLAWLGLRCSPTFSDGSPASSGTPSSRIRRSSAEARSVAQRGGRTEPVNAQSAHRCSPYSRADTRSRSPAGPDLRQSRRTRCRQKWRLAGLTRPRHRTGPTDRTG